MTITSVGYNGAITATVWPKMQAGLSQRYWVNDFSSVVCTPVQAGTRQVSVGTGVFGGQGVYDQVTAAETVTLPTVSSQTGWFMICARRTWQSSNATTFVAVSAGTTANASTPPNTLPTRNTDPGTIDDQPLWLVPLTVNDTVPGTPIDLRVMGTAEGSRYVRNALALQYLDVLGAEVWFGDILYRRRLNAAGNATEWLRSGNPVRQALTSYLDSAVINYASGWGYGTPRLGTQGFLDDNNVQIDLCVRKYDADLTFDENGGLPDNLVGTLTEPFRPAVDGTPASAWFAGGTSTSSALGSFGCQVSVNTDGTVLLMSGLPNLLLRRSPAGQNTICLRVSANYTRGDATP